LVIQDPLDFFYTLSLAVLAAHFIGFEYIRPLARGWPNWGSTDPLEMTPMDLVLDVLLLRRGREVSDEELRALRYPLAGPVYVTDWTDFTPMLLSGPTMLSVQNLRAALIDRLDACFRAADGYMKPVYFNIGQGLLLDGVQYANGAQQRDTEAGSILYLAKLFGNTMNIASDIRGSMGPEPPRLSVCVLLGTELCTLCWEHHSRCLAESLEEGASRQGLPIFKGLRSGLCQADGACNVHENAGYLGRPDVALPRGAEQPLLWPGVAPDPACGFERRVRMAVAGTAGGPERPVPCEPGWAGPVAEGGGQPGGAQQWPGGHPAQVPLRHADGQPGPACRVSPTGTPEGTDFAFLSAAAGHGLAGHASHAGWTLGLAAVPAQGSQRKRREPAGV